MEKAQFKNALWIRLGAERPIFVRLIAMQTVFQPLADLRRGRANAPLGIVVKLWLCVKICADSCRREGNCNLYERSLGTLFKLSIAR